MILTYGQKEEYFHISERSYRILCAEVRILTLNTIATYSFIRSKRIPKKEN